MFASLHLYKIISVKPFYKIYFTSDFTVTYTLLALGWTPFLLYSLDCFDSSWHRFNHHHTVPADLPAAISDVNLQFHRIPTALCFIEIW